MFHRFRVQILFADQSLWEIFESDGDCGWEVACCYLEFSVVEVAEMELWWICEVSYGQFSVPFKMYHFLMAA